MLRPPSGRYRHRVPRYRRVGNHRVLHHIQFVRAPPQPAIPASAGVVRGRRLVGPGDGAHPGGRYPAGLCQAARGEQGRQGGRRRLDGAGTPDRGGQGCPEDPLLGSLSGRRPRVRYRGAGECGNARLGTLYSGRHSRIQRSWGCLRDSPTEHLGRALRGDRCLQLSRSHGTGNGHNRVPVGDCRCRGSGAARDLGRRRWLLPRHHRTGAAAPGRKPRDGRPRVGRHRGGAAHAPTRGPGRVPRR